MGSSTKDAAKLENNEAVKPLASTSSRTRSIAFVALSIALIAVSAWFAIPIGPVPITFQMFAITLVILVLTPRQAICAVAGYLALGAIGVPVFSGMRGGIGILMGPTGGYLWGYLAGVALAVGVLALFRSRGVDNLFVSVLAGVIFTLVAYLCGWLQFQFVMNVGPAEAFLATVAPFIVIDLVKIVAAAVVARAVILGIRSRA